MNKAGLVDAVAKDLGISKSLAEKAITSVLETIREQCRRGVNLVGFGNFSVAKRAARNGRDPRTGKPIKIKACKAVRFKAGKAFKDLIQ
jgi:DNA-binding protein HU-beta